MLEDRFSELEEIRAALERAIRAEARCEANPVAFLRRVQPELANVLVSTHASDLDQVSQLRFRATLAAVIADLLPRLIAEYEIT